MYYNKKWLQRVLLSGLLSLCGCGGGGQTASVPAVTQDPAPPAAAADTSLAPELPTAGSIAVFQHPVSGDLAVAAPLTVTWGTVATADAYRLIVGTVPTQSDLYDSGLLDASVTAASLTTLPPNAVIYARLYTRSAGVWRFSDAIFSTAQSVSPAQIVYPANGATDFDAGQGFQWESIPMARSYQLTIGTAEGRANVYNGGGIRSVRRWVSGLPLGTKLFGRLQTNYLDGTSASVDFTFQVSKAAITADDEWSAVVWGTAQVRDMASSINLPFPNSEVADFVQINDEPSADCSDFASALRNFLMADMGLTVSTRIQNICLNPNLYDCHTLVEVQDRNTRQWSVVDPTFGLYALRTSDSTRASALDLSNATRAQDWFGITYEFITPANDAYLRAYYLDYPLLFVNLYGAGPVQKTQDTFSIAPFYEDVTALPTAGFTSYALRCAPGITSVDLVIDGSAARITCNDGDESISHVFLAGTIALSPSTDPASFQLIRPLRYRF